MKDSCKNEPFLRKLKIWFSFTPQGRHADNSVFFFLKVLGFVFMHAIFFKYSQSTTCSTWLHKMHQLSNMFNLFDIALSTAGYKRVCKEEMHTKSKLRMFCMLSQNNMNILKQVVWKTPGKKLKICIKILVDPAVWGLLIKTCKILFWSIHSRTTWPTKM